MESVERIVGNPSAVAISSAPLFSKGEFQGEPRNEDEDNRNYPFKGVDEVSSKNEHQNNTSGLSGMMTHLTHFLSGGTTASTTVGDGVSGTDGGGTTVLRAFKSIQGEAIQTRISRLHGEYRRGMCLYRSALYRFKCSQVSSSRLLRVCYFCIHISDDATSSMWSKGQIHTIQADLVRQADVQWVGCRFYRKNPIVCRLFRNNRCRLYRKNNTQRGGHASIEGSSRNAGTNTAVVSSQPHYPMTHRPGALPSGQVEVVGNNFLQRQAGNFAGPTHQSSQQGQQSSQQGADRLAPKNPSLNQPQFHTHSLKTLSRENLAMLDRGQRSVSRSD